MIRWPFSGTHLALGESVSEALGNLRAQGQRSALALLGILIGAASIVAVLTVGHMAQQATLKMFRHLGVDLINIHAMPAEGSTTGVLDRATIERCRPPRRCSPITRPFRPATRATRSPWQRSRLPFRN
jgi:hypothetical protein